MIFSLTPKLYFFYPQNTELRILSKSPAQKDFNFQSNLLKFGKQAVLEVYIKSFARPNLKKKDITKSIRKITKERKNLDVNNIRKR